MRTSAESAVNSAYSTSTRIQLRSRTMKMPFDSCILRMLHSVYTKLSHLWNL